MSKTSSIVRKLLMALTGFFLMVFLLQHLLINMLSVISPEMFNSVSLFMGTNPAVQFAMQPILMFSVISNHVFSDGNKRTGLAAALLFLRLNDYRLKSDLQNVEEMVEDLLSVDNPSNIEVNPKRRMLANFTLGVASGKIDLEKCQKWFAENIEKS